jgi:hypothetical protein
MSFGKLLTLGLLLLSAQSWAAPTPQTYQGAVLHFCAPGLMDCGGADITVDGKTYRAAGANQDLTNVLNGIVGSFEFQHVTQSAPFEVTGYVSTVKNPGGWGPPSAEVFFITDGLQYVPVPK